MTQTLLTARAMTAQDVPACCDIVNHIIALGGSTAHETPFDHAGFRAHYYADPDIANVVTQGDQILGFQALYHTDDGVYSVGTFTDRRNPVRGAGRALFEKTRSDAAALGAKAILAEITSDNTGGLAFYGRMGFAPFETRPADFTRANGVTVDRIVKRFTF